MYKLMFAVTSPHSEEAWCASDFGIIEGTRVFVDHLIGHLENGMSMEEICQEYDLIPEQVMAVKYMSPEQVMAVKYMSPEQAQYIQGYADALENVATR